jgi:hypothetical protein
MTESGRKIVATTVNCLVDLTPDAPHGQFAAPTPPILLRSPALGPVKTGKVCV